MSHDVFATNMTDFRKVTKKASWSPTCQHEKQAKSWFYCSQGKDTKSSPFPDLCALQAWVRMTWQDHPSPGRYAGRTWLRRTCRIGVWNRSGLISFATLPAQRKQRLVRQELSGTMRKRTQTWMEKVKAQPAQDSRLFPFIFAIKDPHAHPKNYFGDWIPMYHSVLSRSLPATTCRRWHWSQLQWPHGCNDKMCWPKITCINIASVTTAVGVSQTSRESLKKAWGS